MTGLYIVVTTGGRRFVVVAQTADLAADAVARKLARDADVPFGTIDPALFEVGRIGNFDPGITGARLADQSFPIIAG